VRRPEQALSDVRAAIDNWTEHAREAGLGRSKSDEVAHDFLLL
jgi:hypothetical protein